MKRERVLIIEDEMDLLDLLDFNMTRKGFSTAGALDGLDGLSKARDFKPGLVILDLMLPGLDGWEVCRRIKENDHETKVLMLTAKCMDEDRAKGLSTGADEYMTKPFSVKELLARVDSLLASRRQTEAHGSPLCEDLTCLS